MGLLWLLIWRPLSLWKTKVLWVQRLKARLLQRLHFPMDYRAIIQRFSFIFIIRLCSCCSFWVRSCVSESSVCMIMSAAAFLIQSLTFIHLSTERHYLTEIPQLLQCSSSVTCVLFCLLSLSRGSLLTTSLVYKCITFRHTSNVPENPQISSFVHDKISTKILLI